MSRSGYTDDCDGWALIRWRGAVTSAIRGARGQAFLRECLASLDAIPDKRLIANEGVNADGEFCTLGAVGAARGMDVAAIDFDDRSSVAGALGIAEALAAEIMFENDDGTAEWNWVEVEICGPVRPYYPEYGRHVRTVRVEAVAIAERRWQRMRAWVVANIKEAA